MPQIDQFSDAVYDKIGRSYDETRYPDPDIVTSIYELLCPREKGSYLDIGCGSGNYTVGLSERGLSMTGLDFSEEMLTKARKKSQSVKWFQGDARHLPFGSNKFDGATCVLATHHIVDYAKAFEEAFRVLKPNSNMVIFTATPGQQRGYWLVHYFPKMMEDACNVMASEDDLTTAFLNAGFEAVKSEKYFINNDLQDWFLHAGKYRPEIYFDPMVRDGISFFAKSPHHDEIDNGLVALKADIESGEINKIIQQYENQKGDYLFLCATKK